MRQEGHLGRQAETAHCLGGHQRNAGKLLGARVFVDKGVGDEQRVPWQHQRIERGKTGRAGFQADHVAHMVQMHVEAAMQAAEHGVGIAELDHQRGNRGGGAAHGGLGRFRAHAVAAQQAVVGFPVVAKARIVLGVDAFHVLAQAHAQAGLQNAGLDHGRTAHQNGRGDPLVQHQLRGAQHAFVFALGIGDAPGAGHAGRAEDRAHQHAGGVDKA